MTFALVTGASQGFGREISFELARRKINLLLVSLPGEGLEALCRTLKKEFPIEAYYYETDLTKHESVYQLTSWALAGFRIQILINNAGIGGSRPFEESNLFMLESMIQINIRAVTLLTRLLLDELKSHRESYILNVASMASFSPLAYKTIYPASKSFVFSFSRGLNQELKRTGVSVTVVHPGPMKTNPEVTSRIEKQSYLARLSLLNTRRVARIAIDGMFQKRSQIVPGIYNKFLWVLMKVVPLSVRLHFVSGIIQQEITAKRPDPSFGYIRLRSGPTVIQQQNPEKV